jgi:hypothetical protein
MIVAAGKRNHDKLSKKGLDVGKSVFPGNAAPVVAHGNIPGGLVDKKQQANPYTTTFGHPFDGGGYRSTAAQKPLPPRTGHNVIEQFNPLKQNVPEISPHEKPSFFTRKVTPIIKTQFGANASGMKSDTAFHPQPKNVVKRTFAVSSPPTEKIPKSETPSFNSSSNLWGSQNHSFSTGAVNAISGTPGKGRWSITKRSVV